MGTIRTLADLIASEKAFVTPQEVGLLLGMHPQTINLMAKKNELPFPFIRSGNRTKIPRIPLMEWFGIRDK